MSTCQNCGHDAPKPTVLHLKSFSRGIYAVDTVVWAPCENPECESGGGEYEWPSLARLADLAEEVTERPLYAKCEGGIWTRLHSSEHVGVTEDSE